MLPSWNQWIVFKFLCLFTTLSQLPWLLLMHLLNWAVTRGLFSFYLGLVVETSNPFRSLLPKCYQDEWTLAVVVVVVVLQKKWRQNGRKVIDEPSKLWYLWVNPNHRMRRAVLDPPTTLQLTFWTMWGFLFNWSYWLPDDEIKCRHMWFSFFVDVLATGHGFH